MGLVRASTEIDIEELKRLVSVIFGEVAAELNVTPTTRRKGDVRGSVEAEDGRSVNDEGASNFHGKIVEGNRATRQRGEGHPFGAGEIGLLKADDVAPGNEVVKSGGNEGAAGKTVHASGVIGEAINIVGDDARNERGRGGEGGKRGRGSERGKRGGATIEHRKRRREGRGRKERAHSNTAGEGERGARESRRHPTGRRGGRKKGPRKKGRSKRRSEARSRKEGRKNAKRRGTYDKK